MKRTEKRWGWTSVDDDLELAPLRWPRSWVLDRFGADLKLLRVTLTWDDGKPSKGKKK